MLLLRTAERKVRIERQPSFVDGVGSNSVLDEMWPLVKELIDDVVVVTVDEVSACASRARALSPSHYRRRRRRRACSDNVLPV